MDRTALTYTGNAVTLPACASSSSSDNNNNDNASHLPATTNFSLLMNNDGDGGSGVVAMNDYDEEVTTGHMIEYMVKMEAHWSRCVEVRVAVHNGLVYKVPSLSLLFFFPSHIKAIHALSLSYRRRAQRPRLQGTQRATGISP